MEKLSARKIALSARFENLARESARDQVTLRKLLLTFGIRGHALIVLMFSAPFLLPIPIPGLSIPFGIIIVFSGLGITFGFPIIFPRWLSRRKIPGHTVSRLFDGIASLMRRFEKLLKPRLLWVTEGLGMRVFSGLVVAAAGFVLALPLPPGTNFPPAIVAVLLALGLLERDGLVFLLGLLIFTLEVALVVGAVFLGSAWLTPYLSW